MVMARKERDELKMKLETTADIHLSSSHIHPDSAKIVDIDKSLNEERLKWQMEMENLRRGFESEMDSVKKSNASEKDELNKRIATLEEKYSLSDDSSKQQIDILKKKLIEATSR